MPNKLVVAYALISLNSVLPLISCSSSTSPGGLGGGGEQGGTNVTVANNLYDPSSLTVSSGSTVTWTWNSCSTSGGTQTCISHSVTFDDGTASPTQSSGTYDRRFTSAGTFRYHCAVHGNAMAGSIVVR